MFSQCSMFIGNQTNREMVARRHKQKSKGNEMLKAPPGEIHKTLLILRVTIHNHRMLFGTKRV